MPLRVAALWKPCLDFISRLSSCFGFRSTCPKPSATRRVALRIFNALVALRSSGTEVARLTLSQAVGVAGEAAVDWSQFPTELFRNQDASFVQQLVSTATAASKGETASRLQTNKRNQRLYVLARAQGAGILPAEWAPRTKGAIRVVCTRSVPLHFFRRPPPYACSAYVSRASYVVIFAHS